MNKKILFFLLVFAPVFFYGQGKVVIHGEFPDNSLDGYYVYIARLHTLKQSETQIIDSVVTVKGKFSYERETNEEPFIANIHYGKGKISYQVKTANFIMEPGNIYIQIKDWNKMGTISGTPINEDYNTYLQKNKVANWNRQLWLAKRFAGFRNQTWTEEDEKEYASVMFFKTDWKMENEVEMRFLEKYVQYPGVIRDLLFPRVLINETREATQLILEKMSETVRDTLCAQWDEMLRRMNEFQIKMDDLRTNRTYTDFTGKTPTGVEITLSKILSENKLALLYFWGAWYTPCVKEMSIVSGIYEKYKNQGLAVIGVSNDVNESKWKTAIALHNTQWLQLISIDGKDEISELYNVNSIPDILLIDGTGTIVSRGLHGNKLINKIDELMSIKQ